MIEPTIRKIHQRLYEAYRSYGMDNETSNRSSKANAIGVTRRNIRPKTADNFESEINIPNGGKAVVFMTSTSTNCRDGRKVAFKLDSGASNHLVNRREYFISMEKSKHPIKIVCGKKRSIYYWFA